MSQLNKSDLEEGEWYYDKDYVYDFETYTYDHRVDSDYWLVTGDTVAVLERHPADQKTESKSIKCVFKSKLNELSIDTVETDTNPIDSDKFSSVKEELKEVEVGFIEDVLKSLSYDIEDISVTGNKIKLKLYDKYEYGNLKITLTK
jgi:hypothetical protein